MLILNQHGDNRGDEAAFRAMIAGIQDRVRRPVRFTVLHQSAGGVPQIALPQEVRWIHLVPSLGEAVRLMFFAASISAGLRWRGLLGPWGQALVEAYRKSDLAISAPGGPYFGDPYAGHELMHWFYVWLADRYHLPLMLYAPSAGPFRKRLLNPLRRRLFRRFRTITLREELSLKHMNELLDEQAPSPILVTDSALQRPLPPLDRHEYFGEKRRELAERTLVAVSAIAWRYPGHPDPAMAHASYEDVVLRALSHLHERRRVHLLFVPQLYGPVHADVPYLEQLGKRLPSEASWEIVDPSADSDYQQRVFGMADLYFASRYHPQVFAISHGVPGVCIYYEHKALGFIRQLDLERFAFPIDDLDWEAVIGALDDVLELRAELSDQITRKLPALRKASSHSSELAVALLDGSLSSV